MLRMLTMAILLAAPPTVAQVKTDPGALKVARTWLRSVEKGDTEAILKTTSVPFTYATTAKVKQCERTVSNQKELSSWAACLRKSDKLLVGEIRQGDVVPADPPNVESEGLKKLVASIARPGTWVKAYINGDGVTFSFRFLLVDGAVAAFLVDADFETG